MLKFIFLSVLLQIEFIYSVRVCDTFADYYNPFSKNCRNNPNDELNITEIIKKWGYNYEEHNVTTDDGYIISIVRCYDKITRNNNVIIGHGAGTSALSYVYRDEKSLVYNLAQNGYDSYIVSFRGSRYSLGHKNLTWNKDGDFWKFSFHELGVYDLRSAVNFVYNKSKKKSIYIGQATGSIAGYVYQSLYVDETKNMLAGSVSLAPLGYVKDPKGIWPVASSIWPAFRTLVWTIWHGMLPFRSDLVNTYMELTSNSPIAMYFFQLFHIFTTGDDFDQMDPTDYPLTLLLIGDNVAVNILTHYLQNKDKDEMRQFDYGTEENAIKYGQTTPPKYEWDKIDIPTYLVVAPNDVLTTKEGAIQFYNDLKNSSRCGYYTVQFEKFIRMDFIMARDIKTLVFDQLFPVLDSLDTNGTC